MTTQVIQTGGTVRVVVDPRGIAGTQVVNGRLIVTYTDGSIEDAGPVGSGGVTPISSGLDFSVSDNSGYLAVLAA